MPQSFFTRLTIFWVIFCAACNVAGWTFSALHILDRPAYILFLIGCAVIASISLFGWPLNFRRVLRPEGVRDRMRGPACRAEVGRRPGTGGALRTRFSRPFPLAFLILAALATLGGILYAPTNYDALAYRTPRVLHWLAEHRWHWIHTEFQRLNARGTGFEWVCAPFISVARTDRFLFLLNVISFLLMPGLIYSVFTRLGVNRRLAYFWMWILPTGYCFLLQVGSIGNDLFTVPFVLASIDFALRARQERDVRSAWLSILSAALFTSAKANTLPLGLVWLMVIIPCWRLLLSDWLLTSVVILISIFSSFVPTALLNQKYSGDWTGAVAEALPIIKANSVVRLIGNTGILAVHTVMPPVFPPARIWNDRIAPRLVSKSLDRKIGENFMVTGTLFTVSELEIEESAGLGLGVSLFLLTFMPGKPRRALSKLTLTHYLVFGAIAIAFLAFMRASFVRSTARLLTPYYPLLAIPLLMIFARDTISRRRQCYVGVPVFGMAILLLVLNPARPLWPANTMISALKQHFGGRLLDRAQTVYSVYSNRAQAFDPALRLLPNDAKIVGIVTFDDPETALWRPFGSRRIVHVCSGDTAEFLRAEGIKYIWVNDEKFAMLFKGTVAAWLEKIRADRLQTISLQLRAGEGPIPWHLVRLRN
jgi:hypothetical protein